MDGEEMDMRGAAKNELILGGRALSSEYKGTFMGQPFLGFGTNGYDAESGQHYSTWADNFTPGLTVDLQGT